MSGGTQQSQSNNLNLGGDAYLALFTLIGAHSVVCIDGNKLKNDRKCTPYIIEKMTESRYHYVGQKGFIGGGFTTQRN